MKKKILILIACLFVALSANAESWLHLETENPNLKLFIDVDSIDFVSKDVCNYAIKFLKRDDPAQVAYVKANQAANEVGVYQSVEYDKLKYNPQYVFNHLPVYMRPMKSNSFLAIAQNYTSSLSSGQVFVDNKTKKKNKINKKKAEKNIVQITDYRTYVKLMREDILANWNPPKNGKNTQTEVIFSVSSDGSLLGYRILKSSGYVNVDRSVVSAVALAAPYRNLPQKTDSYTDNVNIKLIFNYKKFKKEVK